MASGRGSNLEAVLKAIQKKKMPATPVALVTDNPAAKSIEIAKSYSMEVKVLPFSEYREKKDYHLDLLQALEDIDPDLIVACGYMRILKEEVIRRFPNQIINIHPSLLPAFPGLNAQKQAFEYGVRFSGCTAHFVDAGVDSGPIILQSVVPIEGKMSERDLTLEILKEEHKILPKAVQLYCENRLKILGRKVEIQ